MDSDRARAAAIHATRATNVAGFTRRIATALLLCLVSHAAYAVGAVTTLHTIAGSEGGGASKMVQVAGGDLYGVTTVGGTSNYGTVFQMTPTGTYAIVHSFDGTDGRTPTSLILGPDGNLYGTTQYGGDNDGGTAFKITPAGTLTVLHSFELNPWGEATRPSALIFAGDGNMYGMTGYGGINSCGTLFRLTPAGVLTTLYSFDVGKGPAAEAGGFTVGNDGALYGITQRPAAVFKMTTAGTITTVHTFTADEGAPANAPLLKAVDGKFYSTSTTSSLDGGISHIFSLTPAGAFATLYTFPKLLNVSYLQPGGLTEASDGYFYGTQGYGGQAVDCLCGALFRVSASGHFEMVHYFTAADGAYARSDLLFGSDGYLYGAAGNTLYRYDRAFPAPPYIVISLNHPAITLGQSARINWVAANAATCTASDQWTGAKDSVGEEMLTPTSSGSKGYALTCTGAGGDARVLAGLNVNPAPTFSFSIMPTTIRSGETATLQWNVNPVTGCSASGAWSGSRAMSGTEPITVIEGGNYSYTLTCQASAGDVSVSGSVTLVVLGTPTININVTPSPITEGQSASLVWNTVDAPACTASGAWSGAVATSGTRSVSPSPAGSYNYALECMGPGGTTTRSATVIVATPGDSIPPNNGPPPAPTVTLSISPASITVGQNATLTWSATNATSCTASNAWNGTVASSGTQAVSPVSAGSYVYALSCTGVSGTASATQTLQVNSASSGGNNNGNTPPADSGGKGGGGGAFGLAELLALGALIAQRRRVVARRSWCR